MSFSLAHLSDVHLGPLPVADVFSDFPSKRLIGAASWAWKRRRFHLPDVANAIRAHIIANKPDHIAFTGDLVNIAGPREFPRGADWLKEFASPQALSFVPGNHDAYVRIDEDRGLRHVAPWMASDKREAGVTGLSFPYLRMRRYVALIGLNSGVPQELHKAGGTLGDQQRRDLEHLLLQLGQQGFYRVVMIHHPPLPGMAIPRKELTDAAELKAVLERAGCELVLFGHNHISAVNWLETVSGPCAAVQVPSASMNGDHHREPAAWNLYRIRRLDGRWQTEMTVNSWNRQLNKVEVGATTLLLPA